MKTLTIERNKMKLLSQQEYIQLLKSHVCNFNSKNQIWNSGRIVGTKGISFYVKHSPEAIKTHLIESFSETDIIVKNVFDNGKGIGVEVLDKENKMQYFSERYFNTVETNEDARNMMLFSLYQSITDFYKI